MGRLLWPLAKLWLFGAIVMGGLSLAFPPDTSDQTSSEGEPTETSGSSETSHNSPSSPPPSDTSETTASSVTDLRTNQAGIDIIKKSEGLRLKAYQGIGGQWLIGYGHAAGVSPGQVITEAEAEDYLTRDLVAFENGIKSKLTRPVSANAFSAMVSLAYNIGGGNFSQSTVLREVNAGNNTAAADAFLLWNKAGGIAYVHLTHRRQDERALFLQ